MELLLSFLCDGMFLKTEEVKREEQLTEFGIKNVIFGS